MEFSFKIKVGAMRIHIKDTAQDEQDFFRKIAPFSAIPSQGPKGFEGSPLEFSRRVVKNAQGKDCFYYSIICREAKQEFKFGVLSDGSGTLFPKGWESIRFNLNQHEEAETETSDDQRTDQLDWCEWCGNAPSIPGVPCKSCQDLGATPTNEEPTRGESSTQPVKASAIQSINSEQITKIQGQVSDLINLGIKQKQIDEKLQKAFGTADVRSLTEPQAEALIKTLGKYISDVEAWHRNRARGATV